MSDVLDISELFELEEALKKALDENLTGILTRLNRSGQLEELLDLMGLSELIHEDAGYKPYKNGKIIVIGESSVKEEALAAVAKKLNLDKSRFIFCLSYEDAKKFNFKKAQWTPTYSAIMVGPMPHSGVSKGSYSSIITAIESGDGYPPVVRMGSNKLNISKSDFLSKLQEMIDRKIIA